MIGELPKCCLSFMRRCSLGSSVALGNAIYAARFCIGFAVLLLVLGWVHGAGRNASLIQNEGQALHPLHRSRCSLIRALRQGRGPRDDFTSLNEVDQKPESEAEPARSQDFQISPQIFFLRVKPRRRPKGVCGTLPVVGDVGAEDFSAVLWLRPLLWEFERWRLSSRISSRLTLFCENGVSEMSRISTNFEGAIVFGDGLSDRWMDDRWAL